MRDVLPHRRAPFVVGFVMRRGGPDQAGSRSHGSRRDRRPAPRDEPARGSDPSPGHATAMPRRRQVAVGEPQRVPPSTAPARSPPSTSRAAPGSGPPARFPAPGVDEPARPLELHEGAAATRPGTISIRYAPPGCGVERHRRQALPASHLLGVDEELPHRLRRRVDLQLALVDRYLSRVGHFHSSSSPLVRLPV